MSEVCRDALGQRLSKGFETGCPDALCAWCRHMKREGEITFNGQPSTKRLKRNIGFVMQVR